LHGSAEAQQRDTLRTRADSLARARADSITRDSLARVQADSVSRARADSLARARADSIRSDSLRREDLAIIAAQQRRADSIKAPTAASEMPVLVDIGETLRYGRDEIYATGALTLGDLLEGIPGMLLFRSGWLGSPEQGAFLGDFGRLRVYMDGIELDALDPRNGGVLDLSAIQLWPLEEVRIERGAAEVRVHLRSWRVRSVTPATRVDIGTGDLETNGYRGYFGRRFFRGEVLQLGAYQFSSRDPRSIGDADQLSLFGRLGWARGRLSVDGAFLRTDRERSLQERTEESEREDLPALDATFADMYARIAWTDTSSGFWMQVTGARSSHSQARLLPPGGGTPDEVIDSSRIEISRPQVIGAIGWGRDALRLSATGRYRRIGGVASLSPVLRAMYDTRRWSASLLAEEQRELAFRRYEAGVRLTPLSRVSIGGAVGRTEPVRTEERAAGTDYRAEVALRLGRAAWLSVGQLSRAAGTLIAPVVFDTGFRAVSGGQATAQFATIRGKFWKDVGLDVVATKWEAEGEYRPQYATRSRLYINTSWPSRFPSGNLNILAAVTHEYRTEAQFPADEDATLLSSQFRTWGMLLEIRLLQATLSYQFRNVLNEEYAQVPGFTAVRAVQFYGVRWNFFN
jgi:hypothetical protein